MMHLEEAVMCPIPECVMGGVEADVELRRQQARVIKLLREGSGRESRGAKTFNFEFWKAPAGYKVLSPEGHAKAELTLEKTEMRDGRVVGTGEREHLRTDLMVTSLGYEGSAEVLGDELPWFDSGTGRIRTEQGRVLGLDGSVVPNVYATGWAARGANGVLAGTLMDANNVAASIVEDVSDSDGNGAGAADGAPSLVEEGIRDGRVIEYGTWRRVDEEEKRRGGGVKERERMGWWDVVDYLKQRRVVT